MVNHGPAVEYFQDTTTGLYWMDPSLFYGDQRTMIDLLSTHSASWSRATSAQVDAMVGRSAALFPGAWIVSDIDPTSTETRNWGEIKQHFR